MPVVARDGFHRGGALFVKEDKSDVTEGTDEPKVIVKDSGVEAAEIFRREKPFILVRLPAEAVTLVSDGARRRVRSRVDLLILSVRVKAPFW